jgi:hypothetical protein
MLAYVGGGRSLGVLPKVGTERAVAEGRGFVTVAWKVTRDTLRESDVC